MNPLRFLARQVARIPAVRWAVIDSLELEDLLDTVDLHLEPEAGRVRVELNGEAPPVGVAISTHAPASSAFDRDGTRRHVPSRGLKVDTGRPPGPPRRNR